MPLLKPIRWIFLQVYLLCASTPFYQTILNFVLGLLLSFMFASFTMHLLDVDPVKGYANSLTYVALLMLTVGYLLSRYQRALCWLVLVHLVTYALPNLISFVVLVKFFKIFLLTLTQNLAYLLSILSCSINLIWRTAADRANARLRPVQEFLNSIRSIREATEGKLELLSRNQPDFGVLLQEQSQANIERLRASFESAELAFQVDFSGSKAYLEALAKDRSADERDPRVMEMQERNESVFNCLNVLLAELFKCKEYQLALKAKCYEQFAIGAYFICKPISSDAICRVVVDKLKNKECFRIDQRALNQTKIAKFLKDLQLTKNFLKFGTLQVVQNSKFDFNNSIRETEAYSDASLLLVDKIRGFFDQLQSSWKYLALVFLGVSLYKSATYLRNYRRDLTYDNRLITNYFVHLDSRRRSGRRRSILPLNPLSRSLACELFDFRRLPFEENSDLSHVTIVTILVLLLIAFFINQLFIGVLQEINNYFRVDINYHSNFSLEVSVNGTGFVAQQLRQVLSKFKRISHGRLSNLTTRDCIRDVQQLDYGQLHLCFLLLFVYVAIKKLYHILGRFRSRLAALFYPEIEKRRTLYLYNGVLNETYRIFKSGVLNLYSKLNGENENLGLSCNELVLEFRNVLLRYLPTETVRRLPFINRDYCKICEQREKRNDSSTRIQTCPECNLTYCARCFAYLDSNCLNCDLPNLGVNRVGRGEEENKTRFL